MNKILYVPDTFHLHINIQAKAEYLPNVLSYLYETITPTHKEEGCLEYKLFNEGNSIIVQGKWSSKMALDMHLLLQFHLKLFEEVLPDLCEKISIQTLKEVEPPITSLSIS